MYQPIYNKDGSLKHSNECQMSFGRKDFNCPRCQELLNGSPARTGWQTEYYSQRKKQEERHFLEIKNHDCIANRCGPVCTAFEW